MVWFKLPPFWPNDPQLWFTQVEAQFDTQNITTESTCFNYIVRSFSPEYATEVTDILLQPPTNADILLQPPTNDPYPTLKAVLRKRTTLSEQHRF